MKKSKSLGRGLFFSVILLFASFTALFILYQYSREKSYRVELLNARLQAYNNAMHENLLYKLSQDSILDTPTSVVTQYVNNHKITDLRVTIVSDSGKVLFDNKTVPFNSTENHLTRNEVKSAIENGSGYAINRHSETTGERYFYSATYYPQNRIIVRSALPYNLTLANLLKGDTTFLWVSLLVFIHLTIILLQFSRKIGASIKQLRSFAAKAAKSEPMDKFANEKFPDNELGDISKHIIDIYQNLAKSREEKERIKHQLTQNIAHELKTPVSSIQGYLETIINNPQIDTNTKQKFINRCYAQTERLTNLINDITLLNRMEESKLVTDTERVDICSMVNDIKNQVALTSEKQNIKINNLLPQNCITTGNRSLLYSIFRNLTDNAINYAGEGSTITIKCNSSDKDFYYFTFYDNGVGVPEEHLEKLFERFYRIDKGRSRQLGGTGLGLAIVKNAVIAHGGTITAYNQTGGGLAFNFTIKKI